MFVTDHIHYPQGGGGGERNTHDLCLELTSQKHAVAVTAGLTADGSMLAWSTRIRRMLPPRTGYARDGACGYPTFRGWGLNGLPQVVDRFRPDVVVVQSTKPSVIFDTLASRCIRKVLYVHEVEDLEALRGIAARNVKFIANSKFTAGRLHERLGVTAAVVRPIIDPERYLADRRDPKSVLFVNTVPRKGLEIAFCLAEANRSISFDFVTSWILKEEQVDALRTRAKAAGNVTLYPPTQDMRQHYARARILLVPSQWEEAWGRVANEAHVNGIPVIATDQGGLPESVGNGGILITADAPVEEWSQTLARLWNDDAFYNKMRENAYLCAKRPEIQTSGIVNDLLAAIAP